MNKDGRNTTHGLKPNSLRLSASKDTCSGLTLVYKVGQKSVNYPKMEPKPPEKGSDLERQLQGMKFHLQASASLLGR